MTGSLFAQLPEAIIVTANLRMAAVLEQQYCAQSEQQTLPAGRIIPLSTWLNQLWLQLNYLCPDLPQVLTQNQAKFYWQQLLGAQQHTALTLAPANTESLIHSAYQLCYQYHLDFKAAEFAYEEESSFLQQLALEFEQLLAPKAAIHACQQLDQLTARHFLVAKLISTPIILYGFDEFTPQMQRFIDCLQAAAVKITPWQSQPELARPIVHNFANAETELSAAISWARDFTLEDQNASVAIVVPDLSARREQIMSQAITLLMADELAAGQIPERLNFNISRGKALAKYPVIKIIIFSLDLVLAPARLRQWLSWFSNPFIFAQARTLAQQELLQTIFSQMVHPELDLKQLQQLLSNPEFELEHQLLQALQDFLAPIKSQQLSMTAWCQHLLTLLALLGWPGAQELTSSEHQVVAKFYQLLQQLPELDYCQSQFSLLEFKQLLVDQLQQTLFQPESNPEARIHFLGVLEAASLNFSAIWFMGLNDATWPQAAKPNPFIPNNLSQEYNLPHASAHRELYFAEMMLQNLAGHCQQLILSYPLAAGELELKASPLIADYQLAPRPEFSVADNNSPIELEQSLDLNAEPIASQTLQGGARLLELQALCPFRAFAELRLGAKKIELPKAGLTKAERGQLVHALLEQHSLKSLSFAAIWQYLQTKFKFLARLTSTQLELEAERLEQILLKFLALETERPEFTTVAIEQKLKLDLEPHRLSVRVDRIDKLASGELLLIDYKTGNINFADLFSERLLSVQLPLYVLAHSDNIAAIAFVQISSAQILWQGVSAEATAVPGVAEASELTRYNIESWQQLVQRWQQQLFLLLDEYLTGCAKVAPISIAKACSNCALPGLCRYADE